METYISLSSPHLGCKFSHSILISMGMKLLKTFKGSQALIELDLDDSKDFRKTAIYKLSTFEGLNWFKNHILVSSIQDSFVNFESARIQITDKILKQGNKGK